MGKYRVSWNLNTAIIDNLLITTLTILVILTLRATENCLRLSGRRLGSLGLGKVNVQRQAK